MVCMTVGQLLRSSVKQFWGIYYATSPLSLFLFSLTRMKISRQRVPDTQNICGILILILILILRLELRV